MTIFEQVDKTNRTAFEFNKKCIKEINQICQPFLDNFKIESFSYLKVLPNGYGVSISNTLEVGEIYGNYLSKEGFLHPNWFKKPSLEDKSYFTWCRRDPIPRYDLPLATGINIIRKNPEKHEGFIFYNKGNSFELENLFLNNLKHLERFGEIFKLKAWELLKINSPKKLVYVHNGDFIKDYQEVNTANQHRDFILSPDCLSIQDSLGTEIPLTKRETECMLLVCRGKTAKEISKNLSISHRTIEKYLQNIKFKTRYNSWSDIIKAFGKNAIIWNEYYE